MPFKVRKSAANCHDCEHRTLRLFCNLSGDALASFEAIGRLVEFPSRTTVFSEGQQVSSVFVVCTGQLKLSTTSREARTMILRLVGPGDLLGLSAALSKQPHEVTAETLEPTQLKGIPLADFLCFFEEHAEVGKKAAKTVAQEYRSVYLDARRLAVSGSAAGKLAQLLLDWAETAACGKSELKFTMALTHEELANMSAVSRETVTRLLNQFERDRLVERRGSSLVILNPESLRELVQ
jgi:CRP/FNR family transcriptional regulator, cyclic AMP receptor protein